MGTVVMVSSGGWRAQVVRGLLVIACLPSARPGSAQPRSEPVPLRAQMLAAEDARPPATAPGRHAADPLAPLYDGLTSLPEMQILAVRGLGRLERPEIVPRIAPLLAALTPAVRAEAANALAQAVSRGGNAAVVVERLQGRLRVERDEDVRSAIARSLGRLPYATAAGVDAASSALLALLTVPAPGATPSAGHGPAIVTVLGVAQGFESLARRTAAIQPLGDAARDMLTRLARYGLEADGRELLVASGREMGRRIRRLAVSALTAGGGVTPLLVTYAAADADPQVRRLALLAAGRIPQEPLALDAMERAVFDPDPRVRIEALRQRGAAGGRIACQVAKAGMADAEPAVVLAGIDLAGQTCEADVAAVEALDRLAVPPEMLPPPARVDWHRPAHALVALARLMPERTRPRLAPFAQHAIWQVRFYAARAAGRIGAMPVLEALAGDTHVNVSEAAIAELVPRAGHKADALYLAALARPDGQLVMRAARALAGTPARADATRALIQALARLTVEQRETSRDVRLALVDRLEEAGPALASTADELAAYVTDFDPAVAHRVAALLTQWRGTAVAARPRPLPPMAPPGLETIDAWRRVSAVVTMAGGGSFRIRLFPDEAPTNVARLVRLAAAGYFNGLTFHRVEPTFVIQGGSPHANEYAGDGPYTRDEVGRRSHLRGTVGISTRGRDTGDGQMFVNLVDNVRLDHHYTIIGEIVEGLERVDAILEGDAIERITLVREPGGAPR